MNNMSLRFELFSKDPAKLVDFYTKILDFKIMRSNERYYSLKRNSVIIGVGFAEKLRDGHYFRPEALTDRKGLGVEIVLEVDDIKHEYEKVKRSGYAIAEELIKREWGLTDFRIVDPDGYYLRITSRT